MITPAFRILRYRDWPCLLCLVCNRISHNPNDVKAHYCGHCSLWLDDLPENYVSLETQGRSPGLLLEGGPWP